MFSWFKIPSKRKNADGKESGEKVKNFLKFFVDKWDVTRAIEKVLGDESNKYSEWEWILFYAILYGAADSFAQLNRISVKSTSTGIKLYLAPYANRDEVHKKILRAGTMPELRELVIASGTAVHNLLVQKHDLAQTMMKLYQVFKIFRSRGEGKSHA